MARLWCPEDDIWAILPVDDDTFVLNHWPPIGLVGVGHWFRKAGPAGSMSPVPAVVLLRVRTRGPAAAFED